MFGHSDNQDTTVAQPAPVIEPTQAPTDGTPQMPSPMPAPEPPSDLPMPSFGENSDDVLSSVTTPSVAAEPTLTSPMSAPATAPPLTTPSTSTSSVSTNQDTPIASPAAETSSNDLLSIKQEALQHLTPLVDHLTQSPEDRFKTTMMMIQAADNKDLIKTAYEAAKEITDEKSRAQALLDIVNEINYFTQHGL